MSEGSGRAATPAEWLVREWDEARRDVAIDHAVLDNLSLMNKDLIELPALIARYGYKVAAATKEHQEAESDAEILFAKVKDAVRSQLRLEKIQRKGLAGEPKSAEPITETRVSEQARLDADWRRADRHRIDCEARLVGLKNAMKALEAKQWALNSIGATARTEIKANQFDSIRQTQNLWGGRNGG